MNAKENHFNFKYKGSRNYVHGTDIFNILSKDINERYKNISNIDLRFHKVIHKNLSGQILEHAESVDMSNYCAVMYFKTNEERFKYLLYENDEVVEGNYEYTEEDIIERSSLEIDQKLVTLEPLNKYSYVEQLVALNKYLLSQLFPKAPGRWAFSRIQLSHFPKENETNTFKLVFKKNMHFQLTKSHVLINEQNIGDIYFSLFN